MKAGRNPISALPNGRKQEWEQVIIFLLIFYKLISIDITFNKNISKIYTWEEIVCYS